MAPPRRRFAKPLSSPRYLSLRHGRDVLRALADDPCDPEKEGKLAPGYEHLHSFYIPGLTGGLHTITVTQDISTAKPEKPNGKPEKPVSSTPQVFSVLAPRFELPPDAVYSLYPAPGSTATHDVLPHILFNDPTLPWERIGSSEAEKNHPPDYSSNRVPWLACLVFTANELQMSQDEMDRIFKKTSISGSAKQDPSMAVNVPMSDLLGVGGDAAITPFKSTKQATKPTTNVVFPPSTFFDAFFSSYDDNGARHPSLAGGPDVSRHRFLAHLREINTTGMADADKDDEQRQREFSVVVGNRVGPLTPTADHKPTQLFVHIVSLEGVEDIRPFPLTGSGFNRVGLISLHSWSYMCLPPNSLNVHSAFQNLAEGVRMLQPNIDFKVPAENRNPTAPRMMKRLEDGYSLTRHRTQTGEETIALYRGPLTPSVVKSGTWDMLSNSGSSLEILDKELGVMDISYSVAWSLGRTLALANRSYTTALSRVRRQILNEAADAAKFTTINATGALYQTKEQLAQSMTDHVDKILEISRAAKSAIPEQRQRSFRHTESNPADLSYRSPGVSYFLVDALDTAAYKIASTTDPRPPGWPFPYDPPYDEFNAPRSPDWVLVLRFVLDLYHLVSVPSHYLLTDQSHLPPESFRLFFIDHDWIHALVDGALSLANHGGLDNYQDNAASTPNVIDDPVRRSIKKAINRYFETPTKMKYRPPVPRFGFYMRSAVVTAFPDLKVSCFPTENKMAAPMLLKHDVIDKDVMMGLFSAEPINQELQMMLFTMPAHQQFFSAGSEVAAETLKMSYKRMYTVKNPEDKNRNVGLADIVWARQKDGKGERTDHDNPADTRTRRPVFIWGTDAQKNDVRLLLVENLAEDVFQTVTADMKIKHPQWFTEKCATAAMMGIQLNSPAWQLKLDQMCSRLSTASTQLADISPCLNSKPARIQRGPPEIARHGEKVLTSPLPVFEGRQAQGQPMTGAVPPHFRRVHISSAEEDEKDAWDEISSGDWPPQETRDTRSVSDRRPSTGEESSSSDMSTPESWSLVPSPQLDPQRHPDKAPREARVPTLNLWAMGPSPKYLTLPIYSLGIFSSEDRTRELVPISPLRQDIVFSIVYEEQRSNFEMASFTVSIPVGPISKDPNGDKCLMAKIPSSGSGATMVSNLRFSVRSVYSQQKKTLELKIKPRSRTGSVPMRNWIGRYVDDDDTKGKIDRSMRTELSVVLYGVLVNQYKGDTDVPITFRPKYVNSKSEEVVKLAKLTKPT